MKKILTLILSAAILAFAADSAEAAKKVVKTETVSFSTNLHCHNCVKKVNDNLAFEKGVKDLKVSLDQQSITVTYDPAKTSKEKLSSAIKKLGYKAEEKK